MISTPNLRLHLLEAVATYLAADRTMVRFQWAWGMYSRIARAHTAAISNVYTDHDERTYTRRRGLAL